ncbi:MAG: endonuclease/exonuclease/phosphatase family protein [Phocaeicola sp.]|nr:endonuclease/exonuclease/phosphatase family protein [Phocaeicola sp.]
MKKFLMWMMLGVLYATGGHAKVLKVFQVNIWQETTMVKGGFDGLADEIVRLDPDIVLLSEVRNYDGVQFVPRLKEALQTRGKAYYGETSKLDVGILSKYRIMDQGPNCAEAPDAGSVLKARIDVEGQTVVVYSAHLDYTHYACYLPRGYDGVTWKKIDPPVVDREKIEAANKESMRDEAIKHVIADAEKEKGNFILLGGDFNEPSHLDWGENVKDLWDHRGAVVRWDCSVLLQDAGFKDSYRTRYPNPVTHPGFTYPADNAGASLEQLDWVPEADGRDRIDFIYYKPVKGVKLRNVSVVGPRGTIVRNQRVNEKTKDNWNDNQGTWPSDHKGVLATFVLK